MIYQATYSPEDNKLRLYPSRRLDQETFERVKAAGFKWAPKQELFVAPAWSPEREDLLLELAGDIEPEQMTLAERAAIKAERLDGYAEKRTREANAFARRADDIAKRFEFGQPILVGHHSERSARRDQERMDAAMRASLEATRTANYWLYRAEGVEAHANRKNSARVRANRIKTLLAELRDLQRKVNDAHRGLTIWAKLDTPEKITLAVNRMDSRILGIHFMAYRLIEKGEKSPEEIKAAGIAYCERVAFGPGRKRWIAHTLNRLGYERELLGPVARFEGALSPAILQTFARAHGAEKPAAKQLESGAWIIESPVPLPAHLAEGPALVLADAAWRDLMQGVGYEVPAVKPAKAPILNLDVASHESRNIYYANERVDYRVLRCTAAQYGKVPNDYRGTRYSACRRYRFKIALARFIDPAAAAHPHDYVAVFLTDSKAHELPALDVEPELELEEAA